MSCYYSLKTNLLQTKISQDNKSETTTIVI